MCHFLSQSPASPALCASGDFISAAWHCTNKRSYLSSQIGLSARVTSLRGSPEMKKCHLELHRRNLLGPADIHHISAGPAE